ncbi:MAG TPA: alpha/beta hydrolase [Candidatus Competibacteraceae bacterium]|nr:alpha/beta hydrolase [Candidatus Competibacteraceae bacterium]
MLEPEMLDFIRATEAFYPADAATRTVAEQRRLYDAYAAAFTPPRPAGVSAEDGAVAAAGRRIPIRLYRDRAGGRAGCILYFHGGGFVLGGLDSHDIVTARLAADTGATVIAVDYRLAPEHRYPAAFDDCRVVLEALRADPARYGVDAGRIVLCGDSAGGNLAAAVALANRDRGGAPLRGLILIYPGLGYQPSLPAFESEAEAPLLSAADVLAYREFYHGGRTPPDDAYAFPLAARDFCGLPPALLLPVEHDPLRDDCHALRERLQAAGVEAELWLGQGLVHGCLRALGRSPGVDALFARMVETARRMLG